ncbi:MAG TPA: hypothetical protein VMS75_11780 [Terriglobales bacterium]|nr:hypothetical protein [Terriglobales bacterium]
MKKAAGVAVGAILFSLLAASRASLPAKTVGGPGAPQAVVQDVQPPKYDYMSAFRSRSTRPLGLKEDPALKTMLDQGAVRWAIRAGFRQVLD